MFECKLRNDEVAEVVGSASEYATLPFLLTESGRSAQG